MKTFVLSIIALFVANGVTAQIVPYSVSIPNFSSQQPKGARMVQNPANGHVYIAGGLKYLYEFNGLTVNHFADTVGLPQTPNYGIDYDNNTLFVAKSEGLYKYENNAWLHYNGLNIGISSNKITCVKSKNGIVYAGSNNGLAKQTLNNWTVYSATNSGIASDSVTAVDVLTNSNVAVGTRKGFAVFDGTVWTNFDSLNSPLHLSRIDAIIATPNNGCWVITAASADTNEIYSGYYFYKNGQISALENLYADCTTKMIETYQSYRRYCVDGQGNFMVALGKDLYKKYPLPSTTGNYNYIQLPMPNGVANPRGVYSNYGFDCFINGNQFSVVVDSCFNSTTVADSIANEYAYGTLAINKIKHSVIPFTDIFTDYGWVIHQTDEAPIGSCRNISGAGQLWIGALDNAGNLKVAASYSPGPLDTVNATTDAATMQQYNKVWKITKSMILYHQQNYMNGPAYIGEDILTWPGNGNGNQAHTLAPFVDLNNNGIYEPLLGDYPELKGDEMLYWIMNNSGNNMGSLNCLKTGTEIHGTAYTYVCDATNPTSANEALNNTIFYHYKIFNRSSFTLQDTYIGWWQDPDLGRYNDDYIGCDTMRNAGFIYNGRNNDSGPFGYGLNPPMQSYVQLAGPVVGFNDGKDNNHNTTVDEPNEQMLFTNFVYYNNDFTITGNPENCQHIFNYMRSRWKDNTPMVFGGNSYGNGTPTNYIFPTAPYSDTTVVGAWNEQIGGNTPADRRMIITSGPTTVLPHGVVEMEYAIVFSHYSTAPNGATTSLALNNAYVDKIQEWYDAQSFPSCYNPMGVDQVEADLTKLKVFPNPTAGNLTISINGYNGVFNYCITDMAGKMLTCENNLQGSQTTVNVNNLAQGIYLLSVKTPRGMYHTKFVRE